MPKRKTKDGAEVPTRREERFINAVVSPEVKTQTEAAIIAGYSPHTAKQIANENLSKPYLAQKVDERLKELKHISKMSDEDIVLYYNEQAMFSLEDCLDEQGQFNYAIAKQNGALKHIKKITFTPTKAGRDRVSIELYSSKDAVDALTGIHGLKQQDRPNEEKLYEQIKTLYTWYTEDTLAKGGEMEKIQALWLPRFKEWASINNLDVTRIYKDAGVTEMISEVVQ